LALGAILFVSLQAIINIGVVTGSMPTKGMSLPFISYGGSNLMVTFIFVGLIINVFRRWDNPKTLKPREI
jgi:cell division protein FtsW